jgi:protein-serine/threonine kinase
LKNILILKKWGHIIVKYFKFIKKVVVSKDVEKKAKRNPEKSQTSKNVIRVEDNRTKSVKQLPSMNGFSIKLNNMNLNDEETFKRPTEKKLTYTNYKKKDNDIIVCDISKFEQLKVIGRGTFGKVILARYKEDNALYALKILKKEHILKTKNLINIKNEKRLLEKIDCSFIIKLRFTFQSKDKIFMVLDYYNGGELFFHLQNNRAFNEDLVQFYAAEIYCALKHLHQEKIIYRDLKPENIILDAEGHIKIIDFGLAKDKIDERNYTSTVCGTNEYIPPEVIRGEPYFYNFDWWGYGILLYEMLYGKVKPNDLAAFY